MLKNCRSNATHIEQCQGFKSRLPHVPFSACTWVSWAFLLRLLEKIEPRPCLEARNLNNSIAFCPELGPDNKTTIILRLNLHSQSFFDNKSNIFHSCPTNRNKKHLSKINCDSLCQKCLYIFLCFFGESFPLCFVRIFPCICFLFFFSINQKSCSSIDFFWSGSWKKGSAGTRPTHWPEKSPSRGTTTFFTLLHCTHFHFNRIGFKLIEFLSIQKIVRYIRFISVERRRNGSTQWRRRRKAVLAEERGEGKQHHPQGGRGNTVAKVGEEGNITQRDRRPSSTTQKERGAAKATTQNTEGEAAPLRKEMILAINFPTRLIFRNLNVWNVSSAHPWIFEGSGARH